MVNNQGYRVTPVFNNGATLPFASGQTYPDTNKMQWNNALHVGVILDGAILVDYDGNHAKRDKKSIILEADLASELELFSMPTPVQVNQYGDSIHWLFRYPDNLDRSQFKQSSEPYRYVDVKTGNQLMHLKPHKSLVMGVLPKIDDLSIAPQKLLEGLAYNQRQQRLTFEYPKWTGDACEVKAARMILKFIPPAESYSEWLDVLMRIHNKFGDSDAAFYLANEWSARAENYDGPNSVSYKISSFKNCPAHTKSFGALCKRAESYGANLSEINRSAFGGNTRW